MGNEWDIYPQDLDLRACLNSGSFSAFFETDHQRQTKPRDHGTSVTWATRARKALVKRGLFHDYIQLAKHPGVIHYNVLLEAAPPQGLTAYHLYRKRTFRIPFHSYLLLIYLNLRAPYPTVIYLTYGYLKVPHWGGISPPDRT